MQIQSSFLKCEIKSKLIFGRHGLVTKIAIPSHINTKAGKCRERMSYGRILRRQIWSNKMTHIFLSVEGSRSVTIYVRIHDGKTPQAMNSHPLRERYKYLSLNQQNFSGSKFTNPYRKAWQKCGQVI